MIARRVRSTIAALTLGLLAACGPARGPASTGAPARAAGGHGAAGAPPAAGATPFPSSPDEPRLTNLRMLTHGGENAEAYFSADGKRLIFQATRPGESECDQIYTMDIDGGNLRRVSTGLGRTTCGYFFPSGDRILYSSTHEVSETCPPRPDYSRGYVWALYDYDIYIANADGSDLRKLTDSPGYDAEATISPDGSKIVFTSLRDGDLDIYVMDADGSNVKRLTHELGYDGGPFFSPDGTKIVYRAHHPTDSAEIADYRALLEDRLIRPGKLDIYVMDADGSNKRRLTNNGAANFAPYWHPDGRRIIFSSNLADPTSRNFDLYLIDIDGTNLERVTTSPVFDGFPMFSPDGRHLVFASNRGAAREGDTNIFIADWVEPGASSSTCPAPPAGSEIGSVVRYLASDALEGRLAGSAGERCAGDYLAASFQRMGLEPAGENGTYFQQVPLASAANPHAPGGTGRNVVARLEGRDPTLRDEAIVIGAHYDHLGRGGFGSLAPDAGDAIHNGADDNASGVAALLAVAERLAADPPARSVVFVAFTGEESGLLGSAHYTAHPAVPLERTRAMLNMDMVGRLGAGPLIVYGTGTAAEWDGILDAAASAAGVELAREADGYGPSDHTSFYLKDIPVLHFFTNTHEDYHRPSDDWDRIDVRGIERVVAVVEAAARGVADRRAALTLRRGAGTPPSAEQGRGFSAYLGSIPDYTPVDHGVRIAGVREGSPAERAGLRGGDIIVGFDDEEIADIYAMTEALRARKPGDRVRIRVLREGRELMVTAVLGERGGRARTARSPRP